MPQSHSKLYAHRFCTKGRFPFLSDDVRDRTHAYIATIIRGIESTHVLVGGVADHVRIFFDMGCIRATKDFVEQIKRE
jgi:putative transposase